MIIEGQSGTGKTTVAKKILEQAFQNQGFEYLTARKPGDLHRVIELSQGKALGRFVVDDFHRLDSSVQEDVANIIKLSAEDPNPELYPKVVLIGINRVGSELIFLVHDIAKRCGIHKVLPASEEGIAELIRKGEEKLNVNIGHHKDLLRVIFR